MNDSENTPETIQRPRALPIRVVVDHREARGAAVEALQAMEGIEVAFEQLKTGDYLVEGRFVFERKTLADLGGSIKDGRLFRQAKALATLEGPLRGALILEGTGADLAGLPRECIQGALITVSLFYGVPVLRARSGEETARLMIYAARQGRQFAAGALARPGGRPKGKRRLQLAILQSLPGVGPGRAEALLATFGGVEAAISASEKELKEVRGLGKRTARAIRWAVEK